MKHAVLITASPRTTPHSASSLLSKKQATTFEEQGIAVHTIHVRSNISGGHVEADYQAMLQADALVITFPLYVFCMPGLLTRFLQDYCSYWQSNMAHRLNNQKVYAVINCGFPEPGINQEAARVIKSFSQKIQSQYRFSLLIGGGGMLVSMRHAPFMVKTFRDITQVYHRIAQDILSPQEDHIEDISLAVNFPPKLYLFLGGKGWIRTARKNGLKKADMFKRPYMEGK